MAAEGTARLIDKATPPQPGSAFPIDPLIILAALAIALAIWAARWGGLLRHDPT